MQNPSALIRRHIDGSGNGFEIDDIISRNRGGIYDYASEEILKIHNEFKNSNYPIGVSNPASFEKLKELADRMEQMGG